MSFLRWLFQSFTTDGRFDAQRSANFWTQREARRKGWDGI